MSVDLEQDDVGRLARLQSIGQSAIIGAMIKTVPSRLDLEEMLDIAFALHRGKLIRQIALAAGTSLIWLAIGIVDASHGKFGWLIAGVVFTMYDCVYFATVRIRARAKLRKQLPSGPHSAEYEFDENEIRVTTSRGTRSAMPWRNIQQVRQWGPAKLLMLNATHYFYLDPSRFVSLYEWNQFLQLAARLPQGKPLG